MTSVDETAEEVSVDIPARPETIFHGWVNEDCTVFAKIYTSAMTPEQARQIAEKIVLLADKAESMKDKQEASDPMKKPDASQKTSRSDSLETDGSAGSPQQFNYAAGADDGSGGYAFTRPVDAS